ncbi:S-adenosyl-L-methionine-dependent methyltransferase [Amanita rubescens]|nr:S-adenosyl-L-methionine-dependent methyltransferase [Amanita rubescens]KAF8344573.1 S-adenosyl-L-methionine-dependent methyltransferase [Amanita rubescens]
MSQQVRQLLDLMKRSVKSLEKACNESDTQLPDLDMPYTPDSEAFRANAAAAKAASVISAVAMQLDAIVSPPRNVLYYALNGHWKSAALRVCLEGNVTEILREAGPEGLHVEHIAAKNKLDVHKLASSLRLLATHHVYREVKPDVFANNRVSSLADTSKASAEIIANPDHKHDNTVGISAFASFFVDEVAKSSAYFYENASDPKIANSGEPADCPFAKIVGNGTPFWDWLERPENAVRQRRFDIGMRGTQVMTTAGPIMSAYDWISLPADALVVDVGGGIGSTSIPLAKAFPQLKIVVQDRKPVVETGIEIWKKELPDALTSGRIQFEAHDFFTPQQRKDVAVFFTHHVLHDWSDKYCNIILKHLRNAATPDTKLICMEMVLPHACCNMEENNVVYDLDMTMLTLFNSHQRTVRQFDELFEAAGWKLMDVRRRISVYVTAISSLEAVPI